jgi:phospholipid/cholesterol/gamma-HCH transport system ATP-binding protein
MIHIHDLRASYGDQLVLDGIELTIARGETLAVVGGSGCGKSTLLRLVAGIERSDDTCTTGSIQIDGVGDMLRLTEHDLMRDRIRGPRIGILFQQGALFDTLDVQENIAWPLREHTGLRGAALRDQVDEALAQVELGGRPRLLDRLPAELSGGEQRRVALARALALRPAVMLYDEPTAGLDPPIATGIARLIRRLQRERGLTAIVATHDMNCARIASDRLALLSGGRSVFCGNLRAALADASVRSFIDGRDAQPLAEVENGLIQAP